MFRVQGSTIEIFHYLLKYNEVNNGNVSEKSEGFITREEAEMKQSFLETYEEEELINGEIVKLPISYTNFSIETLDITSFEWLNGIDVGTTDNAMQEAIKIYQMGEEKYLESLKNPITVDSLKDENKQLKTRIAAQEESNKFLEDCIVEMAAIVYV